MVFHLEPVILHPSEATTEFGAGNGRAPERGFKAPESIDVPGANPIQSIDFSPAYMGPDEWCLVTAGGDKMGLWTVRRSAVEQHDMVEHGKQVTLFSHIKPLKEGRRAFGGRPPNMSRPQSSLINVVRFSPDGRYIASGNSTSQLTIDGVGEDGGWTKRNSAVQIGGDVAPHPVSDLAWSPDSRHIVYTKYITGALICTLNMENSKEPDCRVLYEPRRRGERRKKRSKLVGRKESEAIGVAWCPLKDSAQIVVQGTKDSYVFTNAGSGSGEDVALLKPHPESGSDNGLFAYDARDRSTTRRPSYSPDGLFFAAAGGWYDPGPDAPYMKHCVYVFTRENSYPVLRIPLDEKAVAVRFCPVRFELREDSSNILAVPYRLLLAVATERDCILYDLQQRHPFTRSGFMHLSALTDVAWSHDGQVVAVSSNDGMVSMNIFEEGDLGAPFRADSMPAPVTDTRDGADAVSSFGTSVTDTRDGVDAVSSFGTSVTDTRDGADAVSSFGVPFDMDGVPTIITTQRTVDEQIVPLLDGLTLGRITGNYGPPHRGHYESFVLAIRTCNLDILFVQTSNTGRHGTPRKHSLRVLELFARQIQRETGKRMVVIDEARLTSYKWIPTTIKLFIAFDVNEDEYTAERENTKPAEHPFDFLHRMMFEQIRGTPEKYETRTFHRSAIDPMNQYSSTKFSKCLEEYKNSVNPAGLSNPDYFEQYQIEYQKEENKAKLQECKKFISHLSEADQEEYIKDIVLYCPITGAKDTVEILSDGVATPFDEEDTVTLGYQLYGCRIGCVVGCYCPPHQGHYDLFIEAIAKFKLDALIISPADNSDHHGIPYKHNINVLSQLACIAQRNIRRINDSYVLVTDDPQKPFDWIPPSIEAIIAIDVYNNRDDRGDISPAGNDRYTREMFGQLNEHPGKYTRAALYIDDIDPNRRFSSEAFIQCLKEYQETRNPQTLDKCKGFIGYLENKDRYISSMLPYVASDQQ